MTFDAFHIKWILFKCKGGSRRAIGAIAPPKTYESNFVHHYFVQFEKQHLRIRCHFVVHCFVTGVFGSILHFCYSIAVLLWDLTAKYYRNRPPPSLTGWIRPCSNANLCCFKNCRTASAVCGWKTTPVSRNAGPSEVITWTGKSNETFVNSKQTAIGKHLLKRPLKRPDALQRKNDIYLVFQMPLSIIKYRLKCMQMFFITAMPAYPELTRKSLHFLNKGSKFDYTDL